MDMQNILRQAQQVQEKMSQAYPTLAEMVADFRHLQRLIVDVVSGLPEEFLAIKFYYHNVAARFLQGERGHSDQHFEQIKNAITAAREA